ncbi:MAG: hydrogenase nickel incorporation protein HypB [Bacillota bacterium]|jgi:hydrogenase nickel incorporation protein HypB
MRVYLSKDLREANRSGANANREILQEKRILMVNLIGSPGAGKTSLLEHTLQNLSKSRRASVIEADLYTAKDAQRLEPWCWEVIQLNTEGACHLEAGMIGRIIEDNEALLASDIIFIENIGNLICPAEFDLGEDLRVAMMSATEGSDKPSKYPLAFKGSQAILISKIDLLPYCDFDVAGVLEELRLANEDATVIQVSAKTGEGVGQWCQWLEQQLEDKRKRLSG